MTFKKRNPNDKILDNSYNQGTIDDINNAPIEISTSYKNSYLHNEYNSQDSYRLTEMSDKMVELLSQSQEYSNYLDVEKNSKLNLTEVCYYLLSSFDDTDYSFAEKFSCLCDVLDIKDVEIFNSLPLYYKAIATTEAAEYSSVIRNQNRYRLF